MPNRSPRTPPHDQDELAAARERKEAGRYDEVRKRQYAEDLASRDGDESPAGLADIFERMVEECSGKDAPVAHPEIGRALSQARIRAGLGRLETAERMGTFYFTVQALEEGRKEDVPWTLLQRYADAIGCDLKLTLEAREEL